MPTYKVKGLDTEPQFLLDTAAINEKYSKVAADPRRWWTGVFRAQSDLQGPALQRKTYESCGRFIEAMGKRRWDIVGEGHVYGPYKTHDLDSSLVILGEVEYKIRAVFRLADTPKTLRTEVPTGLIRRDPEHRLSLKEAVKAIHYPRRTTISLGARTAKSSIVRTLKYG